MEHQHANQGLGQNPSIRIKNEWVFRTFLVFLAFFWVILVGATWADADLKTDPLDNMTLPEERDPPLSRGLSSSNGSGALTSSGSSSEDEYSFNWLDPDKKIYVLQNRKYLKSNHPLLSVMGGVGFSNPYRNSYNLDTRLAYYFSESWGIEGFYTLTGNSDNNTVKQLESASGNGTPLPNIREIRGQYGLMAHYVPWYAKINVFNSILYFDWYFGLGFGQVQSFVDTRANKLSAPSFVGQTMEALFFSTGHQYYLSQKFIFRMDLTGALYSAPLNGTVGDSAWYSNINFGLGLGWRI